MLAQVPINRVNFLANALGVASSNINFPRVQNIAEPPPLVKDLHLRPVQRSFARLLLQTATIMLNTSSPLDSSTPELRRSYKFVPKTSIAMTCPRHRELLSRPDGWWFDLLIHPCCSLKVRQNVVPPIDCFKQPSSGTNMVKGVTFASLNAFRGGKVLPTHHRKSRIWAKFSFIFLSRGLTSPLGHFLFPGAYFSSSEPFHKSITKGDS